MTPEAAHASWPAVLGAASDRRADLWENIGRKVWIFRRLVDDCMERTLRGQ